jgi:hypothetical protein
MPDYEDQKAKLNFRSEVDYYDSTDFAQIYADVENDAWIGAGDAMATIALLRSDGSTDQVYLPVNVQDGPVTRGAIVTFPIADVTRQIHGETQISMTELSGAEASGADTWTVFYGPIRNPFDE